MIWMEPIWQAPRPFAISRIELLWSPGESDPDGTVHGVRPPGSVTAYLCAAEDPSVGPHAEFVILAGVTSTMGTESEMRAVAEVQGIGPRVVKPGWWIGAFHDASWLSPSWAEPMGLTLIPHGTFV